MVPPEGGVMPQAHDNQPSMPMSLMAAPQCAACGRFMRLALIDPHEHFSNLDDRQLTCTCGATAEYLATHEK